MVLYSVANIQLQEVILFSQIVFLASKIWDVTDLPPLKESRPEIPKRVLRECKVSGFVDPSSSGVIDSQLGSPCRYVIGFLPEDFWSLLKVLS